MGTDKPIQTANFLRGVPAEEALVQLIEQAAEGYSRAIRTYGTGVLQYGHFCGFTRLREQIARLHDTDPARVIAGNGGLEIISLFFKSLPRESLILIEESSYDRVIFDAGGYGHRLQGVPLTAAGIDLDRLQTLIKKNHPALFYGIPFHHNPTGITYTAANIAAAVNICRENGVLCAWDICYEPLRYDGQKNTPIPLSDEGPILISSFTKTISPGTKCGYIVLPRNLMANMEKIVTNSRLNPNLPTQAFIADFIEAGEFDRYLDTLRGLYKPRLEALNRALANHFPDASAGEINGGFFATLRLPAIGREREQEYIDAAKAAGVSISPAWGALAPDLLEEKRQAGLLIRLTFPASKPEQITWGIETLHDLAERFH